MSAVAEDPRDFGLTAADLRAAADLLYPPDDPRFQPLGWTLAEQARFSRIRSRLRGLADATEEHPVPSITVSGGGSA